MKLKNYDEAFEYCKEHVGENVTFVHEGKEMSGVYFYDEDTEEYVFISREMTREQQIIKASREHADNVVHPSKTELLLAFSAGVKWADNNPVNIWHDASEEPKDDRKLLIVDFFGNFWVCEVTDYHSDETWEDYVTCYQVNYWIYIKDLLPKGNSFFNKLM